MDELGTRYAVLRNWEGLPDHNDARDIDLIITRRDYRALKSHLLRLLESTGWSLLTLLKSDRLVTWVTARVGSAADPDQLQIMQWDFFFDTSVWGIQLMSAEQFLAGRVNNGTLWHVGPEARFLDKYLYNRAVGAPYPAKYASTRAQAAHLEATAQQLRHTFGMTLDQADRASRGRLLARALGGNLRRRPLGLLAGMARFAGTFARNYLTSATGLSVGFTGPDGAGKTTVIDAVIGATGSVFGKAHVYLHFRPMLFGNLGEVAHSAGLKKEVDREYDKPHRGARTSKASSLARLAYYTTDYVLGWWLRVKPSTRITRMVVFDRYYTDICVDSRRTRIYLPFKMLYWWGRCLVPRLRYQVLLTAPTDVILARKAELDAPAIDDINRRLDWLAAKPRHYKVLNTGTPAHTAADIWRLILQGQHRRNRRRL